MFMALECGEAFPDAVEAICDVVVPYEVVTIAGWLQGQQSHRDATTGHPRAFLRLLNAVLSADAVAIPPDLGAVLDECLAATPSVRSDPAFVRLDALRRRSATQAFGEGINKNGPKVAGSDRGRLAEQSCVSAYLSASNGGE